MIQQVPVDGCVVRRKELQQYLDCCIAADILYISYVDIVIVTSYMYIMPLQKKSIRFIEALSPYRAVNCFHVGFKNQSV